MPNGKIDKPIKGKLPGSKGKGKGKSTSGKNSKGRQQARNAVSGTGAVIGRELEAVAVEHQAERARAKSLAMQLCVPNAGESFGVQDGYSSYPTGDAQPTMVIPGSFSATEGSAADTLGIPYSEGWAFAYRDPRCALQFYDGTDRTFSYTGKSDGGELTNNWRANEPLDIDYWDYASGFEAHGPILYTGVVEKGSGAGSKWTLGTERQTFSMTNLPFSQLTRATISCLVGDEVVQYERLETTSAGGTGVWAFGDFVEVNDQTTHVPAFFHWGELTFDQDVALGTLTLINTGSPVLRQYALADWQDVEDVIEKIRFPSLNLMYSNTAPELSRNGFICGWQVPSNIDGLWLMTQGFEHLANRPGAGRMDAVQGLHIFWKSTDPLDWEYLEVGDADGASSPSSYVIQANSDYLAISLSVPVVAGRAGYWSVLADTQYRHDSVWFPQHFPDHNRHTFELALEIQSRVPQIHCNPFHIKDIFKWIGGNKGRINQTLDLANNISGYRASPVITPLKSFLDIWFK